MKRKMIEEIRAKEYLQQRLSAERNMSKVIVSRFKEAIRRILAIFDRYDIEPKEALVLPLQAEREIEAVIKWLTKTLHTDVEELCFAADKKQKDHIVAFVNKAIIGMTLASRIKKWAEGYVGWVRAMYAKGLLHDVPPALPMKSGSQYGMDRLLRHTIARAWMEAKKQKAMDNDAVFFSTHRGSSYPCAVCDDEQAKGLQPISQFSLPLHNNCCCYATFYNKDKQPINI